MEGKAAVVAALLPTLLLPLLLSHQPRAIADVHLSVAALADRLSVGGGATTALFEACSRFLDLLNRRNMILLCNAILLIVLRDAGLLACPAAARRNGHGDGDGASSSSSSRSVVTVTAAAASSPVAASAASSRRRPHATRSVIVVWRPSKVAVVEVMDVDENDDDDRLRRHRTQRGHEPATATATTMAPCPLPPAPEKLSYNCPDDSVSDDHVSAGAIVIAEEGKNSPVSDSDHHFADADTNGRDVEAEAVDQYVAGDDHEDVDDMNMRFEEFIANTRRQMQLESLQLQLVMKA